MELMKKKKMMRLVLLLFILNFIATIDARLDSTSFITQVLSNGDKATNYNVKSTTTACCKLCLSTGANPPRYRCADAGTTCHSACKDCFCSKLHPTWCLCRDFTDFCYDKCNTN
ncbi:unnamed protein product [Lathyrus oleraceus]|uniref:Bowman-Birk serine protease inhibitors family domain-containing protein n=1 Tax=Pisum sativum TaxID=3888 RepID=A0A9D4XZ15_PEA|nr:hypothetical protein KIW84_033619 [Pisum sativum]